MPHIELEFHHNQVTLTHFTAKNGSKSSFFIFGLKNNIEPSSLVHPLISICLSVCPSICLSVTPVLLCSSHHIIIKFSGVINSDQSDVHANGRGQRWRSPVVDFYAGPSARGRQLYCRACNFKNVSALLAGNFNTCRIELNGLPLLMYTATSRSYSKDIH